MRTVAFTGGTGFVGRGCAAALAAAGWRVRLLVRRDPGRLAVPVELVLGDLADEAALVRLVRGVDAVVHAAGVVRGRDAAAFMPVNRDASGRLAAVVAREAAGCRFVLISSQAARCPGLSPYAASKRAGEVAVVAALGATPWVILRPGVVYGPWDEGTWALRRLADLPLVPVTVAPEPVLSMVHVSDVASAVVACCGGGFSGAVCELGAAHGWREIVHAASVRARPRFVALPDAVFLGAGRAADCWSAVTGADALFGAGKAREILHRDWRPAPALALEAAGWRPSVTLADGFAGLKSGAI